jgi:nucleoid-associated protein YgaU
MCLLCRKAAGRGRRDIPEKYYQKLYSGLLIGALQVRGDFSIPSPNPTHNRSFLMTIRTLVTAAILAASGVAFAQAPAAAPAPAPAPAAPMAAPMAAPAAAAEKPHAAKKTTHKKAAPKKHAKAKAHKAA